MLSLEDSVDRSLGLPPTDTVIVEGDGEQQTGSSQEESEEGRQVHESIP